MDVQTGVPPSVYTGYEISNWNIWSTITVIIVFVIIACCCGYLLACRRNYYNLHKKHVIITGGSSGIGKSMAIEAAKLGADVTVLARNSEKLQIAVNEIEKSTRYSDQRIKSISLDVSCNYNFIESSLHDLEETSGPVYMLINCAGTAVCGVFEDLTMNDIHHLINLNLLGTIHVTKALLSRMKTRNEGHIIITASQAAFLGIYGLSVYSCTKFALRGLAESLNMEVKPFNINVTLALPPDTDTPGFANEEQSKPAATKEISKLGGLYKPEVVAKQIMKDALAGNFFSTVGFDSKMTSILCCGMSPINSLLELVIQSLTIGFLRFISPFGHWYFNYIVRKYQSLPSPKKSA